MIEATLLFYGNFNTEDVLWMTLGEAEKYYEFYCESKNREIVDLMNLFSIKNIESTRLAQFGKRYEIMRYISKLTEPEVSKTNNIESQFEGVSFG